ncbi:MAG: ComEC/Rec2 family competence protein, partial [Gemmobacter sp.]
GALGALRGPEGLRIPAAAALCAALGLLACGVRAERVAAPVLGFRYYGPIEGRVVAIDRSFSDKLRVTLEAPRLEDVAPGRTPWRVRVSFHGAAEGSRPEIGSTIRLIGHLGPPEGPVEPGGFDFRRMAWFRSLGAVGYTRTPPETLAPPAPRAALVNRLRDTISVHLIETIGGDAGGVAAALTTGDRSGIGQAATEALRASNLSHLLSISGLHMGLITAFVFGAAMQVVMGCGSGTLVNAGSGNLVGALALFGFIAGSFAGTLHLGAFAALGTLPVITLQGVAGTGGAVALTLAGLALAGGLALRAAQPGRRMPPARLWLAAGLIAVLATLNLIVAGQPWGVVYGLGL